MWSQKPRIASNKISRLATFTDLATANPTNSQFPGYRRPKPAEPGFFVQLTMFHLHVRARMLTEALVQIERLSFN